METIEKIPMTLGQKRIRVDFNSEEQDYITLTKKKAAKLLDFVNESAGKPSWSDEQFKEWIRLKELALTAIEEASMWIIKAETL